MIDCETSLERSIDVSFDGVRATNTISQGLAAFKYFRVKSYMLCKCSRRSENELGLLRSNHLLLQKKQ